MLDTCARLGRAGFEVTVIGVGPDGLIDLDELRRAMQPGTILVSVMAANNEIGTLQPLAAIGAMAHEHGALLHTDAAQGAGKVPIDVQAMQIDLLSLTGHKFYGPKGAGALFIRKLKPKLALTAQIDGGGQESGMRSGTLNVPGIVGRRPRGGDLPARDGRGRRAAGGAARSPARGRCARSSTACA